MTINLACKILGDKAVDTKMLDQLETEFPEHTPRPADAPKAPVAIDAFAKFQEEHPDFGETMQNLLPVPLIEPVISRKNRFDPRIPTVKQARPQGG